MIEIIDNDRCIRCDACINICPTNVFKKGEQAFPQIDRQQACQTCFMCELYCPADALFVSPLTHPIALAEETLPVDKGSYRQTIGWGKGQKTHTDRDASYLWEAP